MTEKMKCENNIMVIDWESGYICDRQCCDDATTYTVDKFGIFYLCRKCRENNPTRYLGAENLTINHE